MLAPFAASSTASPSRDIAADKSRKQQEEVQGGGAQPAAARLRREYRQSNGSEGMGTPRSSMAAPAHSATQAHPAADGKKL
eukprot:CAMPEP_0119303508 /NCGR_PEP_ID=MMETSP1333-20130426/4933_1 /TAXON_ID=418940 /ORGANISM="Scyphosphaera apsteinii, Strain RCC1455" /LENGTH=80 /DNA_ID=CAMNT_0007306203 /DNA_START=363 /DNA_END=605 /DNA_ORIENTATION=+